MNVKAIATARGKAWRVFNDEGEHIATVSRSAWVSDNLHFDYHRHDQWSLPIRSIELLVKELESKHG